MRLALLAALALSACGTASYITAGTIAAEAKVALGAYQLHTHAERMAIAHAHPECRDVACREAALAPFESRQAPVLACIAPLAPLVSAAELALEHKDASAATAVLPELAAKALACKDAIEGAK